MNLYAKYYRKKREGYCLVPFTEIQVGYVQSKQFSIAPCCIPWFKDKGILYLTPEIDTSVDLWNNKKVQLLRKSILDRSYKYCDPVICPHLRQNSLMSEEEVDESGYRELLKPIIDVPPKSVVIAFDRSCNFACPSCRSAPYRESGAQKEKFEKAFLAIVKDAENLTMLTMGEALYSPITLPWLRSLSKSHYPKLNKIILFTNGALFNQQTWTSLTPDSRELIKEVHVSIDAATEEVYKRIRGAGFTSLLENLDFIKNLKERGEIESFIFYYVVQAGNYHEMLDFFKFAQGYRAAAVHYIKIENWYGGKKQLETYYTKAVHLPIHKEYKQYKEIVQNLLDYSRMENEAGTSIYHNF